MKVVTYLFITLSLVIPVLVYIDWIYLSSKDIGVATMGFGYVYIFAFFIHITLGVLWAIFLKQYLGWYFFSLALLICIGFFIG
jgi:hypothetical protein